MVSSCLVMECKQRRGKGRGRGVLALTSFEPCPRPSASTIGNWHQTKQTGGQKVGKQMNGVVTNGNGVVAPVKNHTNQINRTDDHMNGNVKERITPSTNVVNNNHRESNGHAGNFNNKDIRGYTKQTNESSQVNGHTTSPRGKTPSENGVQQEVTIPKIDVEHGDMIAKYSYTGKHGRPGGFDEISIKQGEKLKLICKGHEPTKNPLWWEVINERGEQGFVPASFCMIIEKAPTALPWLENKRLQEEQEEKKKEAELETRRGTSTFGAPAPGPPKIKEYKSAYSTSTPQPRNKAEAAKEYYCEICDKNLNGPQPYKAHMSSKAHREEVEYQQSKNM